ncbi:hypothetical protein [Deinococcus geothermalis]|uniref:hypothetical protein n=1 Tax=Deinococcus geothermalis TaxID=68909 RepID=UPI00031086E6|nr:hypothetical protein [Deinococcus geothermalis]
MKHPRVILPLLALLALGVPAALASAPAPQVNPAPSSPVQAEQLRTWPAEPCPECI